MAHTQGLILTQRSLHSDSFVELQRSFPSHVQVISPFVDQLMRFILGLRSADGSEVNIEMAVREALANAVVHGNCENPASTFRWSAAATQMEKSRLQFRTTELGLTAMLYRTQPFQKAGCSTTVAVFTS